MVEAILPGGDAPAGTQDLGQPEGAFGIPRGLGAMTLDAATVRTLISLLPSGSQINPDTWIQHVDVAEDDTGIDITIGFGPEERYDVPLATIKQDLYTRLGARPDSVVRVRIDQPIVSRVLARVPPVAGFGWSPFEIAVPDHPVSATDEASEVVLSNRLLTVAVSKTDGTFALNGHRRLRRPDRRRRLGDSYNYSPPRQDRLVTEPDSVSLAVTSSGPVEASATIVATYTWPDHVDPMSQDRVGEHTVERDHDAHPSSRRELRTGRDQLREPEPRPSPPRPPPASRTRRPLARRMCIHRRPSGSHRRGTCRRVRATDFPFAAIRLRRRANRRPRRTARVRTRRPQRSG